MEYRLWLELQLTGNYSAAAFRFAITVSCWRILVCCIILSLPAGSREVDFNYFDTTTDANPYPVLKDSIISPSLSVSQSFDTPVDTVLPDTIKIRHSLTHMISPLPDTQSVKVQEGYKPLELEKIIVKDKASFIHKRKKISRQRLDRLQIQNIPAVQGDPIRAINTLPGVTTQSDASVRPFVRGGKAEETRVFWDDLPLLQPYHFAGLYSLFNVESIEDINIYSGAFPVTGNNAMSGAIFLKSRPAPLDSLKLFADISFLRGNFYTGVPIIKNKLGVYFSYQAFWYDWFFNRTLDVIEWNLDDENFTNYRDDFQKYVDLPNFRDFQFGSTYKISQNILANYVGLISYDIFSNMWTRNAYYVHGNEVAPQYYERHLFFSNEGAGTRSIRSIIDTLAIVGVDNDIHNVNFKWDLADHLVWINSAALQSQKWHVEFFGGDEWEDNSESLAAFDGRRIRNSDGFRFKLNRDQYNFKSELGYYGIKKHGITAGASYDYQEEVFDADMFRVFFELIYNGNTDLLSSLGHYGSQGVLITKNTPGSDPNIDYVGRLIEQMNFQHTGKVYGSFYCLYAEDSWSPNPRQRLTVGLRLEYEENSGDYFPSPRLSYFHNINKANEITFAAGIYSQNDVPFYIRQSNNTLNSEKSFHANFEWTHHFTKSYRLELQSYYKYYWDLVTPGMYNTRELIWGDDGIGYLDSAAFSQLSHQAQEDFIDLHGQRDLRYANTGIGNALGLELSFFYDPVPVWNGWISAEVSMSQRRDNKGEKWSDFMLNKLSLADSKNTQGEVWYDFRFHRPWIINWVNYFKFPSSPYEFSIRARYAAGLPYTNFNTGSNESSDTLLYIGPKNEERYMSYQRVDIRLTKSSTLFGHPYQWYFAVWNFFNRPNFMLRDKETEQARFINFNIPFPVIFYGMNFRW